jgi:hypothetical protein
LLTPAAALVLGGCRVMVHDGGGGAWSDDQPAFDDSGPGHPCTNDGQCRTGCFCDPQARVCHGSGGCTRDSDCGDGFRCDGRATCVPRIVPPTRDAGPAPDARPDAGVRLDAGAHPDAPVIADARPPTADATPASATCDAGADPTAVPVCARCRFDLQCGPGARCRDGRCEHGCTANAGCGTGDVCAGGFCVPDARGGGQCVYGGDCAGGGTCINAYCHPACGPERGCPNRADLCDRGVCRPDGRPLPPCRGNADCAGGTSCVDGICRVACGCDDDCSAAAKGSVCQRGFCFGVDEPR